jgi:hypothetical protein
MAIAISSATAQIPRPPCRARPGVDRDRLWIATGRDIAEHWRRGNPP